jgi:hypothetical protein
VICCKLEAQARVDLRAADALKVLCQLRILRPPRAGMTTLVSQLNAPWAYHLRGRAHAGQAGGEIAPNRA